MRFVLFVCLLLASVSAGAQGKSGSIKVRRPAGMTYFVDISTPPVLKPHPQTGPVSGQFSDGILRVTLPCEACEQTAAMVWMELNVTAEGIVEQAKITSSPYPEFNATLNGFAETKLTFHPTILEGRRRAVRFAYPILLIPV